jgi:membrane-bound metal-dependent hydrolase YbcI (DUF457 family)
MFIGHFAVAFASKRVAPRTSLGMLVAAVSLLDLIWPVLVLTGLEVVRIDPGNTPVTPLDFVSYPYSHSLAFVVLWAVTFAGAYYTGSRYWIGSVMIFIGVVSHWVLDVVSHRPDLPLFPGSEKVGLGLWNSMGATVMVEGAAFLLGVWLYTRGTRARNAIGRWSWWALVVFLLLVYAGNLAGSPPPSPTAVAAVALAAWLFPVWAWWVDRHRTALP